MAWYQVIVITKRISYQGIDICNCISYMFISNICIYLIKDMYTSNTHTYIYIYVCVCDVCMYVYIYTGNVLMYVKPEHGIYSQ